LQQEAEVDIFDIKGNKILSTKIIDNNLISVNFSAGIYLVHINSGNQSISKKLIVE
jgi:hypothetical protein